MEIRHLKLVCAVHSEGSLTAAAGRLHLTQSALSHQLKEIEDELGAALFNRMGRRMVLTAAGERVLETAQRVLGEIEQAQCDVERLVKGDAGRIRIATECYTCYHWLPSLMKAFRERYPKVDVRVVAEATRNPVEFLERGELDVAITSCEPAQSQRLCVRELFEDELLAVVAPDHPLARRKFINAGDFAEQVLILYNLPTPHYDLYNKFLTPAGVRPAELVKVELTEAILEMVKADLGMTVMAHWAVQPYLEKGDLVGVRIGRGGFRRMWHAVTIAEREPEYVRDFVSHLATTRETELCCTACHGSTVTTQGSRA